MIRIRWEIIANLLFAMFSCLIVIALMRWVAKPLVWLSILGVLVMLGFGKSNQSSHQNKIVVLTRCIFRNVLLLQAIFVFEKSTTNRYAYQYEFKFVARYIDAKSEILALYWYWYISCAGHHPSRNSCATKTDCNCYCIGQRRQQVCQRLETVLFIVFIF